MRLSPFSKVALVLFLVLGASAWGQNPRTAVALVEPLLSAEAKAGFVQIADSFAAQGYDDLSTYFRQWSRGGYGSGVLVSVPGGSTYLVTNRHVAAYAESVTVTFFDTKGGKTVWADCPVLYRDPRVDIALIGVPQGKTVLPYTLQTSIDEGAEVWSAGYPGLGGRPEWQLAKGNVTNASVAVPDMGPEADAVFLQHTASIDPGNSGGPLLVGELSKPESLRVVGINTWKARGRSNTFYSVPAQKVLDAIQRYQEATRSTLEGAATEFEAFVNGSEWDKYAYRKLISYRYGSSQGWTVFQKDFEAMSSKDKTLWSARFSEAPLDTLSQYLAFRLWTRVRAEAHELVYENSDDPQAEAPVSRFTLGKQTIPVTWVFEDSRWKVKVVEWPDAVVRENPAAIGASAGFVLRGAALVPLPDSWDSSMGLGISAGSESRLSGPITWVSVFSFSQDSPSKADFATLPPTKKYNFLEYGIGLNYYYTIKLSQDAFVAPFLGVRGVAAVALPQLQAGFLSPNTGGAQVLGTFLVAAVVEPRIGVEFSPNGAMAFGADLGLRWFVAGLAGPKTVPLGIYAKWIAR